MNFKTIAVTLTAASFVSAANHTNGSNATNATNATNGSNGSGHHHSSDSGAIQGVGAGIFGAAAAAGVALLL